MKQRLYAIYDEASRSFGSPTSAPNDAVLRRALADFARSGASAPFVSYPDEHIVYFIGDYDTDSAAIDVCNPPERLGNIREFLGVGTVPPLDVTVPTDTKQDNFQS